NFMKAYQGGVTSCCTGPGSANVLGGQFASIKTYGHRVDDMIIQFPAAMKCAFGENVKMCYRNKSIMTRMATAATLRETLAKAFEYSEKKKAGASDPTKMPPFDMKMEAMLPVVNKEIPLKAHAHRADDIFTAIRIAKEFGVKLTLEHCTDGHLIADDLVKEGYCANVGPSLGDKSKFELKNKSFVTPGVLSKAGVQVSIITDSPVIPLEYLPVCAGLAVKAGMDEYEAYKAITINPAKTLGIDHRVGSLKVGKDADVVIWDRMPMDLQANVVMTMIDGHIVYQR
ncbi:MAG: amidohydrolase family protein, partial [Erysipelotrichaceae bacterium]|nr:amidohydrolase family protein [Erysipelotrichaceae bacterium]